MTALPSPEHTTASAVMAWWERNQESGHRPHLGASLIGHPCERHLWLTWRWAKAQRWDGRMLRLFDDGKRAEERFIEELRGIGAQVWDLDENMRQFRVAALGGHFGGSLDAVVLGIPEAPKTAHVAEFKTSNDKLFKTLVKDGVRKAKPQHFAQMQTYMGLMDMERALYMVENKNDASIYTERVEFDKDEFTRIMQRAERIMRAVEPPPRLSDDADYFECKWCSHHGLCHGTTVPEVNCRTCAHSTPVLDGDTGAWTCDLERVALDEDTQREGCTGHRYIPILLQRIGESADVASEPDGNMAVTYRLPNGTTFVNGAKPGYLSREIATAQASLAMLGDEQIQELKAQFPKSELVSVTAFDDMQSDDLEAVPTKADKPAEVQKRARIRKTLDSMKV